MRTDGKTERHDEANSFFRNIANALKIQLNKANREKVKKIYVLPIFNTECLSITLKSWHATSAQHRIKGKKPCSEIIASGSENCTKYKVTLCTVCSC